VLIGEAGVGKTAIAEGLALRIHRNEVPETLAETRIVALDLSGMIAGAQFRGQFEKRFKAALEEVVAAEGKIVLFIDELHTVLGAGAPEGAMDAANILKPLLARGELRVIGATTLSEYQDRARLAGPALLAVTVEELVDDTVDPARSARRVRDAPRRLHRRRALVAAARLRTGTSANTTCPTRRSTWSTRPRPGCARGGMTSPRARGRSPTRTTSGRRLKKQIDASGPRRSASRDRGVVATRTGIRWVSWWPAS
jgi:ATP-dependent Clp protease ATP-binding subunit ClpC